MRRSIVSLCFVVIALNAIHGLDPASLLGDEPKPVNLPEGFKLAYKQSFDDQASLQDFQFSDKSAWRWSKDGLSGGCMELFQQSKYKTEHRSPFNLAMLSTKQFGDFVLELDMLQTGKEYGHRDMCIYFGFQAPMKFYYTHLATKPDPNAHNLFIVNNAPRKSFLEVPKTGVDWSDEWKHVRLQRIGENIQVYFQDMKVPVLQGKHSEIGVGNLGFGSFDDTGKVDNVQIWSTSFQEKAATLFP